MTTLVGAGTPVPYSHIEAELARQALDLRGHESVPVRLARMSNLIVYCDDAARAEELIAEVPKIIDCHPARVLFLLGESKGEDSLSAAVNSWCELGPAEHVCSEQITLCASGHGVQRLPFAVRGLLIGDLPINVWWASRTPPSLGGPLLRDLSDRAQQILYDSIGWADPPRDMAAAAGWVTQLVAEPHEVRHAQTRPGFRQRRVVSDLNWRRLKYWRRVLGQALDPATAPGAIDSITEVTVEHGPQAVIQAWELVSWLASRLHWRVQAGRVEPGAELIWQVQAPRGLMRVRVKRSPDGPATIRRVRITCSFQNVPGALDISAEGERVLKVVAEGVSSTPRTVIASSQALAELIARQLSDREPDDVFYDSMSTARVFAQCLA